MEDFVLDKAAILERLGADEEIFAVLGDMFVSDVDNYCGKLESALAAAQADVLQREAHTVKGLLATFADDAGAAMAMAVEQQAKQGELAGLGPAVAALQDRVRLVAAGVRAVRAG